MKHITPARVKKWLEANRKAGRRPKSRAEAARLRGCARSLLTDWLKGHKRSRPLESWFAQRMNRAT